ncbi:hypothetical protein GCM10009817_39660 [Terrabacter lapilli]|uniref:Uncharacterized protein n=1 Tax=Terrabacter lapilli TaxID=436231 RepID=A0ABP5E8G9_9MICO
MPLVLFLLDRPVPLAGHPAQVVALGSYALIGVLLIVLSRARQGRTQPLRSSSAS